LTLSIELDPEDIEHRYQAIETACGLAILDLMHDSRTHSSRKRNLILPKIKALAFAHHEFPDAFRDPSRPFKL
jgi:hypothetical protein